MGSDTELMNMRQMCRVAGFFLVLSVRVDSLASREEK